jgi:superfamily I DNA/RNA helicase
LDQVRRALELDEDLRETFDRAWPLLDPVGLIAHFWSSPSFLRSCAPWLSTDDIYALQRADARAWTVSDLPLLDAARQRIGDPEGWRRRRQRDAAIASEREGIARVVDDLIAADAGDGMVQMLRAPDAQVLQDTLIDEGALPTVTPDLLAGPFAHIVVDEAQELTDAEWGMLLSRCPSRSFTIVGDRAQARHGFSETWAARLARIGLEQVTVASLTVNYRTPEEVMAVAEPVIREVLPDANVPVSIRSSGIPVRYGSVAELGAILGAWLGEHAEGIACVISIDAPDPDAFGSRVRSLTPELAKGLEFDLVVLVDPELFGTGIQGAVDRYVAMTRATQQLVVLTS